MRRYFGFLMLSAAGCVAPPRVITLPNGGLGAFTYETGETRRRGFTSFSVAVVRPEAEVRFERVRAGGGGRLADAAAGAALGRAGLGMLGSASDAAAADARDGVLRTEGEVDKRVASLVEEFQSSAARDIGLALATKGFDTGGSFRAVGDMTFAEKQAATYVLLSKFRFTIDKAVNGRPTFLEPVKGVVDVAAECDAYLVEPLSGEKFWSKQFKLERQQIPFAVQEAQTWQLESATEDHRPEAVGKALQAVYKEALSRIAGAMDAEAWSAQAADARTLKRRASPVMR